MSFFKRKERDAGSAVLVQPGQCSLTGLLLEDAARRALDLGPNWELGHMQPALIVLAARFSVALTTCRSGWACNISRADIGPDSRECVREFGSESPAYALARAAVVAVSEWGW